MAPRAADWTPLTPDGRDPVPGDPGAVRAEAALLGRVADSIRDQVTAMRKIAAAKQSELKGKYAGTISSTAGTLADQLNQAENRYRTASGELSGWATELESAQTESESLRKQAATQQDQVTANTPGLVSGSHNQHQPPNPAQQQALDQAHGDISKLQGQLQGVLDTLHAAARRRRDAIGEGEHGDGLTDGFWDKFNHYAARWVSDACNALGWIATACAIVALFVPGLNILATIALLATIGSLAGHIVLAVSGSGSWFDVGLDVFALATFGMGKFAGKALEESRGALETVLKDPAIVGKAGEKAAGDVLAENESKLADLQKIVDTSTDPGKIDQARHGIGAIDDLATKANAAEAARISKLLKAGHNFDDIDFSLMGKAKIANTWEQITERFSKPSLQALLHGEQGAAACKTWAESVRAEIAGVSPHVVDDVTKLESSLTKVKVSFLAGATSDTWDKVAGSTAPFFGESGYYNWSRSLTPQNWNVKAGSW
ncbi:hypothetical protein [Catenulispora pinisilvae]|uniref:hypothetical protein n=1 Tax=Catenulispora pinisilvae TaxID=2705253 RepID=UPI0018912856|nr:hypothetical protein [Catenulispora pinisilvae]